jgi:hypothetical protein
MPFGVLVLLDPTGGGLDRGFELPESLGSLLLVRQHYLNLKAVNKLINMRSTALSTLALLSAMALLTYANSAESAEQVKPTIVYGIFTPECFELVQKSTFNGDCAKIVRYK